MVGAGREARGKRKDVMQVNGNSMSSPCLIPLASRPE